MLRFYEKSILLIEMKKLPIYDVVMGDMNCLSLVARPAIEEDFMLFAKEGEEMKFAIDDEKRIAFGAAIIADKPIIRQDADGSLYYVVFSADVIRKLVQTFMANKERTFSEEHDGKPLDGVTIIESFFKRDGLQPKGFENIADGSWFVALKIDNDQVWEDLKSGKRKGFSVECTVQTEERPQPVQMSEVDEIDEIINSL